MIDDSNNEKQIFFNVHIIHLVSNRIVVPGYSKVHNVLIGKQQNVVIYYTSHTANALGFVILYNVLYIQFYMY